jgi:hypothetical protein
MGQGGLPRRNPERECSQKVDPPLLKKKINAQDEVSSDAVEHKDLSQGEIGLTTTAGITCVQARGIPQRTVALP